MSREKRDYRDKLYRGSVELFPGFYIRPDGVAILNVARFHAYYGYEDTPETRRETEEMVRKLCNEMLPGTIQRSIRVAYDEAGEAFPVDENGLPM